MGNGILHSGSWLNSHLAAPFGWPRSTLVMDLSIVPCKARAKAEVVVRVPQAQTRRHLQLAAESAENAIDGESPQTRIFLTPAARVPTGLEGAGVRGPYGVWGDEEPVGNLAKAIWGVCTTSNSTAIAKVSLEMGSAITSIAGSCAPLPGACR